MEEVVEERVRGEELEQRLEEMMSRKEAFWPDKQIQAQVMMEVTCCETDPGELWREARPLC